MQVVRRDDRRGVERLPAIARTSDENPRRELIVPIAPHVMGRHVNPPLTCRGSKIDGDRGMIVSPPDNRRRRIPRHACIGRMKNDQPIAASRLHAGEVRKCDEDRLAIRQNGDLRISAVEEREFVAAPGAATVARYECGAALTRLRLFERPMYPADDNAREQLLRIRRMNGEVRFRKTARISLTG